MYRYPVYMKGREVLDIIECVLSSFSYVWLFVTPLPHGSPPGLPCPPARCLPNRDQTHIFCIGRQGSLQLVPPGKPTVEWVQTKALETWVVVVWGPVHRGLCILHHGWAQGGLAWQGYSETEMALPVVFNLFSPQRVSASVKPFSRLWLVKPVCVGSTPGLTEFWLSEPAFSSGSCVLVRPNELFPWEALLITAGLSGNFPHALWLCWLSTQYLICHFFFPLMWLVS